VTRHGADQPKACRVSSRIHPCGLEIFSEITYAAERRAGCAKGAAWRFAFRASATPFSDLILPYIFEYGVISEIIPPFAGVREGD
jgi:hypothetical protein